MINNYLKFVFFILLGFTAKAQVNKPMVLETENTVFSPEDFAFSQSAVKTYKSISNTIWKGTQYRLVSPYEGNRAVLQNVAADRSESIVYSYTMNARFREIYTKVKFQGLLADKKYTVAELNLYPGATSKFKFHNKEFSGEYLMKIGLDISFTRTA